MSGPYDASTLPAALAAAEPGDTLTIAAGVHTFNTPLTVPDGVSLMGAGMALTTLKFPTIPSTIDVYGLVYSGEGDATLSDLTLEGPATASASGKFSFGIYINGTFTTASVTCTNVKVTRPAASAASAGFYRAIMDVSGASSDLGAFTLNLAGCDLSAGNGVLNMYCDPDVDNKTLIATNTTFHTTGASHLAYIHPGISFSFTDCTFSDCPNYAVQHFSASAHVKARYAKFRRCTFESDLTHGVLTSDQTGALTEFYSCEFRNTAASNAEISARTSIRVWSSKFTLGSAANGIQGVDDGTMEILGCTFKFTGLVAGGGALIAVNGGEAHIENCSFDVRSLGTSAPKAVWVVAATTTATATIRFCHFHASKNVPPATDAPYAVYVGAGGDVTVERSRLTGYYIPVYGAMHLNSDTGTISVDHTKFYIGTGLRPLYQTPAGGTVGAVTWGSNNTLGSGVASPSYLT